MTPITIARNGKDFWFTRQRLFSGFDGKFCKVQPMIASDGTGNALISFQKLLLSGSDVFYGQYLSKSTDDGKHWSEPVMQMSMADTRDSLGRRVAHFATIYYSAKNNKWFAIGNDQIYANDAVPLHAIPTAFDKNEILMHPHFVSVDIERGKYTGYTGLPFPLPYVFCKPFGQIVEEDDGTLLLGFYYRSTPRNTTQTAVVYVRYRFNGDKLEAVEAGRPVERFDLSRGIGEPSLTKFQGRYYLTLRSDEQGLVATSDDGLNFSDPMPWKLSDGSILANRNTQQHWINLGDRLFLAYTREGANNDHVFRNRAPIFMAQVDPNNLCIIHSTELPLVPELGARLGNFCVAPSGPDEQWLITAEWMQPAGCEKYGSDNSLWLVAISNRSKV